MNYDILMLSVTIITTLTGIICAYYARKSCKGRRRGKPKGVKHKPSQSIIECELTTDNVTVNMKITASQSLPAEEDGYFHK